MSSPFVKKRTSFRLPKENLFCPNNASKIYIFISWRHQITRNARINHLQERVLRIVYNDNESTFVDLLKKDNSLSIHHKNIRLLGMQLHKVKNNLSNHLMSEIFNLRNIDYNLRSQTDLKQGPVNTVNYGLKSLSI